MAKSKDTPEVRARIEQALEASGSDKAAIKAACIGRTTYWRWANEKRDFRDLLTRAKEKFINLTIRTRPELEEMAMQTLTKMLTPQEVTRTKRHEKVLMDRDTGKELQVLEVTIDTVTYTRPASLKVLEKVLGKGSIEEALWRVSVRKAMADPKGPLYEVLFGERGKIQPNKEWGDDPFADAQDLMTLRELQERTRERYEDGLMTFEQYHSAVLDEAKTFSYIKSQGEIRAKEFVGADSYMEVMSQVQQFLQLVIDVEHEVANDVSISRKDIPAEIERRVRQRSGADRSDRKALPAAKREI